MVDWDTFTPTPVEIVCDAFFLGGGGGGSQLSQCFSHELLFSLVDLFAQYSIFSIPAVSFFSKDLLHKLSPMLV